MERLWFSLLVIVSKSQHKPTLVFLELSLTPRQHLKPTSKCSYHRTVESTMFAQPRDRKREKETETSAWLCRTDWGKDCWLSRQRIGRKQIAINQWNPPCLEPIKCSRSKHIHLAARGFSECLQHITQGDAKCHVTKVERGEIGNFHQHSKNYINIQLFKREFCMKANIMATELETLYGGKQQY